MADERIEIELEATDDASQVIDRVADAADELEDARPTVEVDADTTGAVAGLDDALDAAQRVDDTVATVDVDTTGAVSSLHDVGGAAQQGIGEATEALSQISGPIGDAAENIGGLAGQLAAFGPAGIIAGAALGGILTLWQRNREAAKENTEQIGKYREAIEKAGGSLEEAARIKLGDTLTDKQVQLLDEYGLTLDDLTRAMRGETLPAMQDLQDAAEEFRRLSTEQAQGRNVDTDRLAALRDQADAFDKLNGLIGREGDQLREANDAYSARVRVMGDAEGAAQRLEDAIDGVSDSLDMESAALNLGDDLSRALDTAGQSANDASRDVIDLKRSIVETAQLAGATPVELQTAIEKVNQGDLQGAVNDAQGWLNRNPVKVQVEAALRNTVAGVLRAAGLNPSAAASSTTNVTVLMPRGAGFDAGVARAVNRYARRNGGRVIRT